MCIEWSDDLESSDHISRRGLTTLSRLTATFHFFNTFATSQPAERNMSTPLKIFIIYAREDKGYKDGLLKSLKLLQTQGFIEPWHDSDIKPGDEWDKEIKAHLRDADIIFPIVSFSFIASDYINRVEIKETFDRYDRGEPVVIIPIIARSCGWKDTRLKDFQSLPTNGRPIKDWSNKDKAWDSIYQGVKEIILEKKFEADPTQRRREAEKFFNLGKQTNNFNQKVEYFSKSIAIDPSYVDADHYKSAAENRVEEFKKDIKDYDQILLYNPGYVGGYVARGSLKEMLGLLKEARLDYHKALNLDSHDEEAKKYLQKLEEKLKQKP